MKQEKRRLWGDLIAAFQYLKGGYKKEAERLFSRLCCDRTKVNGFKVKDSEALAQVAQRGGGLPVPGDIQGQAGQSSEKPDGAGLCVPAHCRGVGLDDI